MRTTIELLILAQQARHWLDKHQLPAPPWPLLPKEWPDATMSPVWIVTELGNLDEILTDILPDTNLRCRALRMRYDPDEEQPWVFVPGLGDDEGCIWLVATRPVSFAN